MGENLPENLSTATIIVAHRGARIEAPENTRSAFDAALCSGVDGIEFDVQLTRDDVPVLYHNRSLMRIAGTWKRVRQFTFSELSRWDWGKWHSERFVNEPLLTLEQAVALYVRRTRLFVEIKSRKIDQVAGDQSLLASRVMDVLRAGVDAKVLANIFILSFDAVVVQECHAIEPSWNYILNVDEPDFWPGAHTEVSSIVSGYCLPYRFMTARIVDAIHECGAFAATYTCNTRSRLHKAQRLGVDVIMTDNPAEIMAIRRK